MCHIAGEPENIHGFESEEDDGAARFWGRLKRGSRESETREDWERKRGGGNFERKGQWEQTWQLETPSASTMFSVFTTNKTDTRRYTSSI